MTIKFTKTIEITGEVWFRIYANDSCIRSFMERDQQEAKEFYQRLITNATQGFPITEVLASQEVPNL